MSEPPLRVALLAPCFWPEVRRGGERFTRELADGLLAHGDHPRLITSHPGMLQRTVEDALPVIRLPRPPQRLLSSLRSEHYLTHVPLSYLTLRAGDYDIAHAVHGPDALAVARWRRRSGRPGLLSFMGIPDRIGLDERRGRRAILERALRGCDAVVALSSYAADAFRTCLGAEVPVIPPPVDVHTFVPAGSRSEQPTIVCSADAGEPRKNVALLIKAFGLVREERPDARLRLSRPRSLPAAQRAGVEVVDTPGVEWSDLDDRSALARAYGQAWVTALPSTSEAFGLVAAESLACGTPVVGYDDGAIPELIDEPGIGILFDRLEAHALAQALLAGFELSGRDGTARACRARAEEFSTDRFTERYLELYRKLGAGRR